MELRRRVGWKQRKDARSHRPSAQHSAESCENRTPRASLLTLLNKNLGRTCDRGRRARSRASVLFIFFRVSHELQVSRVSFLRL
eukprot:2853116-Rhodomonas_salina.1